IMTQALPYALMLAFFRNEMGFGGNNGLTDFKDILGYNLQADGTRVSLFIITAFCLAMAFLLSRSIMQSRFGRVVLAIRDAEPRSRFVGYRVERYKLWLFVYSASLFPSLAKSSEYHLAIFRAHIHCNASLLKNLDGNEMIFEKKNVQYINFRIQYFYQPMKNEILLGP
ncbi:MAG: hypothetical protein OIF58_15130, partial [Cohaesibacter sp.]|nr:hypothetical protein [Cohaesibacter sp.]